MYIGITEQDTSIGKVYEVFGIMCKPYVKTQMNIAVPAVTEKPKMSNQRSAHLYIPFHKPFSSLDK